MIKDCEVCKDCKDCEKCETCAENFEIKPIEEPINIKQFRAPKWPAYLAILGALGLAVLWFYMFLCLTG